MIRNYHVRFGNRLFVARRIVEFYSMIVIGSLALIGFPFLTGFYSKDLILEVAYGKYSSLGYFSYCLGTLGAFFTAFYSMRLSYLTFLSKPTGHKQVICFAYDSGPQICIALGCLAVPSILIGYYTKDMLVGVGSNFFGTAIYVNLENFNIFDAEFIDVFYKTLPVNLSLLGFFSSFIMYNFRSKFLFKIKTSTIGKKVYYFLNRKWFFDKLYNEYLGQFFFKFGYSTSYKVRVNSLQKGLWRGTGKEALCFLRASVYSRFLDFNFGGCSTQGRLDLLLLSLSSNLWGKDSLGLLISSWVCNVDIGMLSNEVNWKKPLPFVCESRKGLYLSRYRPGGELDMKFSGISDVSPVLIFNFNNSLKYNNYTKHLLSTNRYFS